MLGNIQDNMKRKILIRIQSGEIYFHKQLPHPLRNSIAIQDQRGPCSMLHVCVATITKWKSLWDAVSNMHHETKKFNFDAQSTAIPPVEK